MMLIEQACRPILLVVAMATLSSFSAEHADERKLYKTGFQALEQSDYKTAIICFSKLTELDESNAEYHFLTGLSHYRSAAGIKESIPHFQTAI